MTTPLTRLNLSSVTRIGWTIYRNRLGLIASIVVLTMLLPTILVEVWTRGRADVLIESLKTRVAHTWFMPWLESSLIPALQAWAGLNVISTIIGVVGYLALVLICFDYFEQRPSNLQDALLRSWKILLRRIWLGAPLLGLIYLLAMPVSFTGVVVSCLAIMVPVVAARWSGGTFKMIVEGLSLGFARHYPTGRWHVFMVVLGVGGAFYTLNMLASAGVLGIARLDLYTESPATMYGITGLNEALWVTRVVIHSILISMLPGFTAAIYWLTNEPLGERPAIAIA
jgi:hypothetical protein